MFKNRERIKELEAQVKALIAENAKLGGIMSSKHKEISSLKTRVSNKGMELHSLRKQIDEKTAKLQVENKNNTDLKAKLRDQNSADILLNAFKAVGVIREEEPDAEPMPLTGYQNIHDQLMSDKRGLGSIAQQYTPVVGGAFGSIF